jgi:hypothetical protein
MTGSVFAALYRLALIPTPNPLRLKEMKKKTD